MTAPSLTVGADLPVSSALYGDNGGPYGSIRIDTDDEPGVLVAVDDGGVNSGGQVRLSDNHATALAMGMLQAVRR